MSEWTFETLKTYVDSKFEANKTALEAALASQEKYTLAQISSTREAVLKADIANEKRFENVNEWRGTVRDSQAGYPTRVEVNSEVQSLDGKIQELMKRVEDLAKYRDTSSGKSLGVNALWIFIIAAIGVVNSAIAIFMLLR